MRQLTDRMLDARRVDQPLEEIVEPHVDRAAMARLALGRLWDRADEDQRRRFAAVLERATIADWSGQLNGFGTRSVMLIPYRPLRALAIVEIVGEGGERREIALRLARRGGHPWRIYDVVVDGESLVTRHRTALRKQMRRGDFEGLIAALD